MSGNGHDDTPLLMAVETEQALIGSVLINPAAYWDVSDFLAADDFGLVRHQWVWQAIAAIHDERKPLDILTLSGELERQGRLEEIGGAVAISRLMNDVPSAIHAEAYGRDVEAMAVRRRMVQAASQAATLAYDLSRPVDEVIEGGERALFDVSQRRRASDLMPIGEAVRAFDQHVVDMQDNPALLNGPLTGLLDLDKLADNVLGRDNFTILAARPGMGKTSVLLQIAENVARHAFDWLRGPVAVFSLEMSREQLVGRMVSGISGIDGERLRRGQISDGEWNAYHDATGQIHALPMYLDDQPGLTPAQLRARCRRLYAEHGGLRLVVIDYLQLMVSDRRGENTNAEMAYISKSLKGLARELGCCVIAASQLSRAVETRPEKRPVLSDLRDSGGLEQDADCVLFLYRDDYYKREFSLTPNVMEIDLQKNRHGRRGKVEMFWRPELTRVFPLERRAAGGRR